MSETMIIATARQIREMEAEAERLKAAAEALKDEIKTYMGDMETLQAGEYRITYKLVKSSRLDTAALKQFFSADDLQPFTRTTETRRFSIA